MGVSEASARDASGTAAGGGAAQQPAIALRGVVKRFGEITAVAGLDLEVAPGICSACSDPTAPASRRRCGC